MAANNQRISDVMMELNAMVRELNEEGIAVGFNIQEIHPLGKNMIQYIELVKIGRDVVIGDEWVMKK